MCNGDSQYSSTKRSRRRQGERANPAGRRRRVDRPGRVRLARVAWVPRRVVYHRFVSGCGKRAHGSEPRAARRRASGRRWLHAVSVVARAAPRSADRAGHGTRRRDRHRRRTRCGCQRLRHEAVLDERVACSCSSASPRRAGRRPQLCVGAWRAARRSGRVPRNDRRGVDRAPPSRVRTARAAVP